MLETEQRHSRRASRRAAARRDHYRRVAHRANFLFDVLEPRRLLSAGMMADPLIAPTNVKVNVTYRNLPDGATNRANLTWTDTNSSETGYRVEYSSNGIWMPIGPDLLANSTSAFHVLNAGQKLYYRVLAVSGATVSTPSDVVTPMMPVDRVVQVTASATN